MAEARILSGDMLTHVPFRSFCPYCVMCKAVSHIHVSFKKSEVSKVPVVSVDYTFMRDTGRS